MAERIMALWSDDTDFTNPVAADAFPGLFTYDIWFSTGKDPDVFHDGDGGPLFEGSGDFVFSTGRADIGSTTGIQIGMYAAVIAPIAGGNDEGYYEITDIIGDDIVISTTALDGIATLDTDEVLDISIGGIWDALTDASSLQDSLDFIGPEAGATSGNEINNLEMLCYKSTALTTTATIDIDAISGSASTRVRLIGTNSDFVDDGTLTEITTASTLANGLFDFTISGASIFVSFENIDYNGGGKDATRAVHCVNESATGGGSDNNFFVKCTFRGSSDHGVYMESDRWRFFGCDFTLNGGSGFSGGSADATVNAYYGCEFSHNDIHGLDQTGAGATINYCIAFDNGLDGTGSGFNFPNTNSDSITLNGNTSYGNATDGFASNSLAIGHLILNNTADGNGGYGFNFNSADIWSNLIFTYNHAFGNTTAPSNIATTDALFEALGNGNNITGDPLFTDAGAGNFIPTSSSPLIDAGVGGTGDTIGALCATAGGGGGVGLLTGLLG